VYRALVPYVGTELATWLNVPAFCDEVKGAYAGGPDPMLDYAAARRLVVLDDLFGRDLTVHESEQIVVRLLDIAYQNGSAMLLTMNQDIQEMTARLRPHEASRALAGSTIIPVSTDKDWRR